MTLMMVLSFLRMSAQDVMVSVVPVQQVLPPQALMYVDNPGKYFNISITNTTSQIQNIYIAITIDSYFPDRMNVLSTPSTLQPQHPITIAPHRTMHITMADLKRQFAHLSSRDVHVSSRLMSGYGGGSYGLLPEGRYQITITAYKWNNPKYAIPVMLSNPVNSSATFSVSYLAKAPQMITPVVTHVTEGGYAEVDPLNAMFSWSESLLLSNYSNVRYAYSLRVVEVLPGQPLDYAMDNNPSVYHIRNLASPVCIIPPNYVANRMSPSKLYAAQVTAEPRTTGMLDYVLVENKGKSDIKPFRVVPIHHRTIEPKDTLHDDELMAFTDGVYEDSVEACTTAEYIQNIMASLDSTLMRETQAYECDSLARLCLNNLQTNVATMRNMSHIVAKKAGLTDEAKSAYGQIKELMTEAEEASDIAAIQYKAAYLTLQKLERHSSKHSKTDKCDKQMYDECVEAVAKAKIAARNAQVYFSSIQKTEYLASKQMKYLTK